MKQPFCGCGPRQQSSGENLFSYPRWNIINPLKNVFQVYKIISRKNLFSSLHIQDFFPSKSDSVSYGSLDPGYERLHPAKHMSLEHHSSTFSMLLIFSPGINCWHSCATGSCPEGHNTEKVPGLRVVKVGGSPLAFYYVSHIQGPSRVTLNVDDQN